MLCCAVLCLVWYPTVFLLWGTTTTTNFAPPSPQEIKTCLKSLPSKEEAARWKDGRSAIPAAPEQGEELRTVSQPAVTEAP